MKKAITLFLLYGVVADLLLATPLLTIGVGISLAFSRNHSILRGLKLCFYILFSLCLIWPLFLLTIWLLFPGYEFMIGTWGTEFTFQRVLNALAFLCGTLLGIFRFRETARRLIHCIALGSVIIGLAVLLLISNSLILLLDDRDIYSFSSPDNSHTIAVSETSFLQSGNVTVYERVSPFFVYLKESKVTDDGYRPIGNKDYSVVWNKNDVTVSFGNGTGQTESITVTFDG